MTHPNRIIARRSSPMRTRECYLWNNGYLWNQSAIPSTASYSGIQCLGQPGVRTWKAWR
jgi:hypothetical protein